MSKLAELRKKKGLSQNDLIKVSGVSKSAILKYEIGERDINKASGTTLLRIATALNCRIEDLLEGKEEIEKEVLFNFYREWREAGEDSEVNFTWDCGEADARKDFSDYAGLKEEITFEEMLELEENY